MTSTDAAFSGAIPALYDRCLGPLLFEPYAEDLADRVAALPASNILETAAGTGIATEAIARRLPGARITATDLNQAMLDLASAKAGFAEVCVQAVDAQALPFADDSFDVVVCQFGVMFFPDRLAAYREACRVLAPGGTFLFNAWDEPAANPISRTVAETVAALFPDDPPNFLERVPFGYHDTGKIEAELKEAGFASVAIEKVIRRSRATPREAAEGLCQGTPLRAEIEQRDPGRLKEATEGACDALARLAGPDGLDQPMSAHVVTARTAD